MMNETTNLSRAIEPILLALRDRTGAMRCTVRIDHPARGLSVNVPCAEVLAVGATSMMSNSSLDHRRARSVRWIEATRSMLMQGDVFADPAMAPPTALVQQYGTRAQLVAPLIGTDDYMFGWVSAHFSHGPRQFGSEEIEAMEAACRAVLAVAGMPTDI